MEGHKKAWGAKAECRKCNGSGLYVGMAERGGDAVVCHTCSGSGCETITVDYTPFTTRRSPKSPVTRVFAANPGIVTAPGAVSGGVTFDEWVADPSRAKRRGAEMRQHTCPAWWYQSADYSKKPRWAECDAALGGSFSQCPSFGTKSACWRRFDEEADR